MSRGLVTLLGSRVTRCLTSSILENRLSANMSQCIEYLAPHFPCQNVIKVRIENSMRNFENVIEYLLKYK
jgi:hypothetical protein